MSLDAESREHLREWLVKSLEPICDADPDVLSKYVLALVQNDKEREDLQDLCVSKLEEFLGDETKGFVSRLFAALSSDSYHPGGNVTGAGPKEKDGSGTTGVIATKEHPETQDNDNGDARGNHHRRRRSHSSDDDKRKQTSSTSRQDDWRSKRRRLSDDNERHDRGNRRSPRKDGDRFPRSEEEGHFPSNRRGYRDGNRGGRGFDRRRGPDWGRGGGRMQGAWGFRDRGFIPGRMGMRGGPPLPEYDPDAYNPDNPSMDMRRGGGPPRPIGPGEMGMWDNPRHMMGPGPPLMGYGPPMIGDFHRSPGAGQGRRGGRGRGGRVQENGEDAKGEMKFEDQTVLKLAPVDPKFVNVTKLSYHFSKFGSVLNVSINPENKSALVQFATHDEAVKAYKSPIPVCNNRFIKVLFEHGIPPGVNIHALPSSEGNDADHASKKDVATAKVPDQTPEEAKAAAAAQGREILEQKKHLLDKQKDIRKQKEALLRSQLTQHRALLNKMNEMGTASHQEKILLITKMNELTTALKEFQVVNSTPPAASETPSEKGANSIDGLQAEYEALESEVAAGRGFGGRRGRGRGRGARGWGRGWGRGGSGRGMNLDNRPTTLKVEKLPPEGRDPAALKQHFENFGLVSEVVLNPNETDTAYIRFQDRYGAEAAMNHGSYFGETQLPMSWHDGKNTKAHVNENEGEGVEEE